MKLRINSIKTYIERINKSGVMLKRSFCPPVRLLLINQGISVDNEIPLMHDGKNIDNEKQFSEMLNHAFFIIVERNTSNKPTSVLHDTKIELSSAIDSKINKYKTHPSIIKIKYGLNRPTCFILNKVNV